MRNTPVSASLYIDNRERLTHKLPAGTIAAIKSNLESPTNADAFHPYKQNTDLLYLTGISQEQTAVILFPNAKNESMREILFIRESDSSTVIWEGQKLSIKEAQSRSGIRNVKFISEFSSIFQVLCIEADSIALLTNEHSKASSPLPTGNALFIEETQKAFPLHQYIRLAPILTELRMVKHGLEVEQISKALSITEDGFRRVLSYVKPGVGEWEIEAEYTHEFIRQGSQGFAYTPIVASGENACVLHYIENDQRCVEGDLLLMDVGSEWNGWNADMTRTIPVSGTFTTRQAEVYDAVLYVMRYAETILRPGISLKDYHEQVMREMGKELVSLSLITPDELEEGEPDKWKSAVKKYYMHGTSHHLGLDVHDVTAPNCIISEGMVFTIEPGIYIPAEKIGIRLEDNYYVGATQNENLSQSIPIEREEIEVLMAG